MVGRLTPLEMQGCWNFKQECFWQLHFKPCTFSDSFPHPFFWVLNGLFSLTRAQIQGSQGWGPAVEGCNLQARAHKAAVNTDVQKSLQDHCQSQHHDTFVYSSNSFIKLGLTFRYLAHFELIFVLVSGKGPPAFSCIWTPSFLAPFVEKSVHSPLDGLGTPVKNNLIYVLEFITGLLFLWSTCLSLSVPH